jgi:hypothetical protein
MQRARIRPFLVAFNLRANMGIAAQHFMLGFGRGIMTLSGAIEEKRSGITL